MNYLAHLYFAQRTADSHFGNLLGDFRRGVKVNNLSPMVRLGLENHYEVDRYTDSHPAVVEAKQLFDAKRRRFAPVALDIYFDHLLIKHWSKFSTTSFHDFRVNSFSLLEQRLMHMPGIMRQRIGSMISQNWFNDYAKEEGIAMAITSVARRIRFTNRFHYVVDDIAQHRDEIERYFLLFFPDLKRHIRRYGPENIAASL
ncbi:MAG: ACP phosphodiesterase [Alteromonas sp. Nap_26]|nr:MAG: ACP phosphodiesterase [Alteromonas sp. Nap_26]